MKVRNILIGLLVVLMAFVFISCEDEPEEVVPTPQPGPAPVDDNTIAKLTVTKDISEGVYKNEKFQMQWDLKKAFGEDTKGIEEGSVLSLQFRSSRDIHWIDFRTNKLGVIDKETGDAAALDMRWIYEEGSLDKLDSLELGEDGWYTLTYTFKDTAMKYPENLDYDKYYYTYLGMNFAGYLMKGDVLEIKNASIDGKVLPLTSDMLYTGYTDNSSLEIVTAHDWTIPKTYAVVYALGGEWRGDAGVPVEAVAAGGKATGVPATNGFAASYALGEEAFDLNTAINSDLILSYTLTPVQWTVTFDTKGGSEMQPKQVTHGTKLSLTNEELPTYPTYEFLGWFLDSDCTQEFDLATETITGNITLYAGWAQNVRHVTIDLDNAEGTDDVSVKNVVDGGTVTLPPNPINPGFFFAGWFVGEDAFNPATPITADITVKAHWTEGTTIYKAVATKGDGTYSNDKFQVKWLESTDFQVNEGDVISFKYRSTVDFDSFNIRNDSGKWLYQTTSAMFDTYEEGDDGWISVSYTFAKNYADPNNDGDENVGKGGEVSYPARFRIDFNTLNIRPGDILELKGIAINGGEELEDRVAVTAVAGVASTFTSLGAADDWTATHTVTFVYDDGDDDTRGYTTDPLAFCTAVTLPEDTAKDGKTFLGWYTANTFIDANKFNTATKLTADTTLYGYWALPVTITLHTDGGTGPTSMEVPYGLKINATDIQVGKVGFFVEWYANEGLTTPFDFENTTITEATNIYAKWNPPAHSYQYAINDTNGSSRLRFRFKSSSVALLSDIQPGDVITFMVKYTGTSPLKNWKVSTISPSEQTIGQVNFSEMTPDGDGWYSVSATVPGGVSGDGLYVQFYTSNSQWADGADSFIIKGLSYNGREIPLPGTGTSDGLYPGAKAAVTTL